MATATLVPTALSARALARYVRVSPQKARLVLDLIRGRRVEEALQVLRFTRKRVARDIEKVLRSALANAERKAEEAGATLDVDQLYVAECYANEGPRWKRIRPAPMGRAYRYQRRTSHILVAVAEHERAAQQRAAAAAAEVEAMKGVKGAVKKVRKRMAEQRRKRTAPARKKPRK
jgi:large subunit ribosomal protein L22